jgi:hypothetical protein
MKKNIGVYDRAARLIAAMVLGILIVTGYLHGTLAIIAGVFAVVFVLTSYLSFCPLYALLHLSSKKDA